MIDIRKSSWALIFALAAIGFFPAINGAAGIEEPLKTALELHESGKIKESITEYDKVIKAHPKLAEAYFNRGNAYYDLGSNQPAIKDYSEAIRLNPKDRSEERRVGKECR